MAGEGAASIAARYAALQYPRSPSAAATKRRRAPTAPTGGPRGCPYAPSVEFFSGSERMRLPVTAKIALATAGAIGGVPGSPMPPHFPAADSAQWALMVG